MYEVEDGIEMPPVRGDYGAWRRKYPLPSMEVGQSFFIADADLPKTDKIVIE